MELPIDVVGAHLFAFRYLRVGHRPRLAEFVVALPPALCAGAMTGSESGCLIQKEEFAITVGREDSTVSVFETQVASYPTLQAPLGHNFTSVVVENPAVAHPGAAVFHSPQLTVRIDAILIRHPTLPEFTYDSGYPGHDLCRDFPASLILTE